MKLEFSAQFSKEYSKIKNKALRLRILAVIQSLASNPERGKPLQNRLKNYRSLKIPPFRILYRYEQNKIIVHCFDHRKTVYK